MNSESTQTPNTSQRDSSQRFLNGSKYCDFSPDDADEARKVAAAWGELHYGEWYKSYDNKCEYYEVVRGYCSDLYKQINRFLRNIPWPYGTTGIEEKIEKMKTIINEAPRVPENIIVYRGVEKSIFDKIKKASKSSQWFCEEGFLSTSLVSEPVPNEKDRYDYMLRIYIPKGTPSLYVYLIAKDRYCEQEMLFLPNTHLRLIKCKWWPFSFSKKKIGNYHFYDCELSYLTTPAT